jgi:hypothetical protein
MKWQLRLAAVTLAWMMVMAALPGCGVSKVKITGKLMKNGQPYVVSKDTYVTLIFAPDTEPKTQTYPAKFNQETGGYELELPAGSYRASYVIVEKDQAPMIAPPEFKQKTYDLKRSQELDFEISAK